MGVSTSKTTTLPGRASGRAHAKRLLRRRLGGDPGRNQRPNAHAAINCAHLGCPVRWFPQSSLFMCPCHGGAYYQDGSRASGPPERGLFEYPYKVEGDKLLIHAGEMPTPGRSASNSKGCSSCG